MPLVFSVARPKAGEARSLYLRYQVQRPERYVADGLDAMCSEFQGCGCFDGHLGTFARELFLCSGGEISKFGLTMASLRIVETETSGAASRPISYCGWTKACTTLRPWETIVAWAL